MNYNVSYLSVSSIEVHMLMTLQDGIKVIRLLVSNDDISILYYVCNSMLQEIKR